MGIRLWDGPLQDGGARPTWRCRGTGRPAGRALAARCRAWVAALILLGVSAFGPSGLAAAELVMFESANCEWCEAWDNDVGVVYHKTPEGRLAPLRRVDLHAPRPDDLSDVKRVVYTPTFVLMDGGREIGRIVGYIGEFQFWGLLGQIINKAEGDL